MTKPIVDISDCYIYKNYANQDILTGVPINYPSDHCYRPGAVVNLQRVDTTAVVYRMGNMVETQRTKYRVANWLTKEEYEKVNRGY